MANSTLIDIPRQSSESGKRRLGIGLGLLVLALWFLPSIIAHSPMLNWFVAKAVKDFNGTVSVGSASLGWFSPVVLGEVSVRDAAGESLMMIPKVESEHTLLDFLRHPTDLGKIRCEKAALEVVFTKEATNLEKALANFLTAKAEAVPTQPQPAGNVSPSPLLLALEFEAAKVTVHDPDTQGKWVLEPVKIHLGLNQEGAPPLQVQVQAVVAGTSPGLLQTELALYTKGEGKTELKGRMDNIPMALAAPVLRRFERGYRLEGRLQGHWDLTWSKTFGRFEGELVAQDCLARGPLLGEDSLQLAQIKMPWKLTLEGSRLHVDKAEITCDVGQVSVQGNIDSTQRSLARQDEPNLNLALDVDLARLSAKLPKTLRLRPDTKLIGGRLIMAGKGVSEPGNGVLWQGKVNTTELRGVQAGQNISWPEPVALSFRVRQAEMGLPVIEQLRCESEFLKLDADGSPGHFTVVANVDLPKLAEPLGRFFDLSQMRLEGKAGAEVTVLYKQPDSFQVSAGGFLRSFHWEVVKGRPVHEDSLTLTFQGDGKKLASGGRQFDSGYLRMQSGQDLFETQIVTPVANFPQEAWGSYQVKLEGDLARWQERIRPWTNALDTWQLGGTTKSQAKVLLSSAGIEYTTLSMLNRDLVCKGPGLQISEPNFDIQGASGKIQLEKFKLEIKNTLARSSSLTLNALSIQIVQVDKNLLVTGAATVQGDMERVRQWFQKPAGPTAELAQHMEGTGNLNLTSLVIEPGSKPKWLEAQGDVGFSWKDLKAFGCDVGPGKVRGHLNAGWLQLTPVETTLNGGQMRLVANLRMGPEPLEIHLSRGLVVDRAQITPAMCSGALGYVIPALAGVTEAQGLVSLSLEGGHLNLTDMTKSDLKGTFSLHSAKVGTSPMVNELSGLLRNPSPISLVKETQVPFQLMNGRVYHQNFELVFPEFTVRTSGSVGLDGTVNLVAEMPVPPRWFGNNPLGAALAKQNIRLPLGGSVDHPRLDPQALQAANAQVLRNTASDVLRKELDGKLMKLLGK